MPWSYDSTPSSCVLGTSGETTSIDSGSLVIRKLEVLFEYYYALCTIPPCEDISITISSLLETLSAWLSNRPFTFKFTNHVHKYHLAWFHLLEAQVETSRLQIKLAHRPKRPSNSNSNTLSLFPFLSSVQSSPVRPHSISSRFPFSLPFPLVWFSYNTRVSLHPSFFAGMRHSQNKGVD